MTCNSISRERKAAELKDFSLVLPSHRYCSTHTAAGEDMGKNIRWPIRIKKVVRYHMLPLTVQDYYAILQRVPRANRETPSFS
jgi:hypothetical protein